MGGRKRRGDAEVEAALQGRGQEKGGVECGGAVRERVVSSGGRDGGGGRSGAGQMKEGQARRQKKEAFLS